MKQAFVLTTDTNYSDEAKVLIYSLRKHHPDVQIFLILCYRNWATRNYEKLIEKFSGYQSPPLHIHPLPEGMSWNKQIKYRYKFACDLASKGYDSVCILDADMLCLYKMDKFFQIAAGGIVVACADNMLTKWTNAEIKHYFKQELPEPVNDIQERVSNVPWFFNPQEPLVAAMLYEMDAWDNHDQCDYTLLNYFMFKHKIIDRVLLTNSYQFTNIHHTMLKMDTFAKEFQDRNGPQIYSEQGQRVYMLHGHWRDEAYISGLMEPMIRNYGWHKKCVETAQNVVNMLRRVYDKYYEEAINYPTTKDGWI